MKTFKPLFGILTITCGLAVCGYSQSFLTNGLVAYYPFNGNANDAVGTNNGTVHGATLTTNRFGIPNSAYSFNGTSAYIETVNALPDMQSASASFWISVPTLPVGIGHYVFMDGDTTGGHDFKVDLFNYTNITFSTKDNINVTGNFPPVTNTWFHIVAVADNNTNVMKIWVNGQLIGTSSSLGNANVGYHSQLYIGCRAIYNDSCFSGAIDDLRFYNRALSDSEVQQLYAYESVLSCVSPPSGLVGWWPGEGNANDIAGTNNGALSGGASFASGEVGQAFSFDGVNGSVVVPDSSSLRLTNQLTIEAWINMRAANAAQSIVSKVGGSGGNNGYSVSLVENTLQGLFNSPGGSWPQFAVTSASLVVAGVWNHVALTYDQSAMKLYFNGVPVATNVIGPHPINTSSSNLRISGDDNLHVYFDGLIDEPAIYNRALSASEIAAIYAAGSTGKCSVPVITSQPRGQVGYWGKSVGFNVDALGGLPLYYQWLKDGTPIMGASGSSLVLTNLQLTDAGNYSVVVTNAYGSITSSNAYLTMNPAGVSLALYSGITIDGVVGLTYGIQYSTDLSNTNGWRGMANVTLGTPTQLWFDVQPASQPQRYYRVVPGPISVP